MTTDEPILATRLGLSVHVSPLRLELTDLYEQDTCSPAACLEDWLVDVANARGANVVCREHGPDASWRPPGEDQVPNEELVVALCQLQCLDRPQMLRLAAQLISRRAVVPERLLRVARHERVEPVLAELARLALRIEPDHPLWRMISEQYRDQKPLRDVLLHWTRLAEPVMKDGRCNAERWKLVA